MHDLVMKFMLQKYPFCVELLCHSRYNFMTTYICNTLLTQV